MRLAKAFDNGEAEPRSLVAGGNIVPPLPEAREYTQLITRIDADAVVADAKDNFTAIRHARKHGDFATTWRVFDRVRQEVDQDLPQRAAVGPQHRKTWFEICNEIQLRERGLVAEDAHGLGNQHGKIDVALAQFELARFDLREIQNIVP